MVWEGGKGRGGERGEKRGKGKGREEGRKGKKGKKEKGEKRKKERGRRGEEGEEGWADEHVVLRHRGHAGSQGGGRGPGAVDHPWALAHREHGIQPVGPVLEPRPRLPPHGQRHHGGAAAGGAGGRPSPANPPGSGSAMRGVGAVAPGGRRAGAEGGRRRPGRTPCAGRGGWSRPRRGGSG